jgi:thymidylate synthase (FAD)
MKAEYISHMGDDLTVVNAARVSFDKESADISLGDKKLIKYLACHGHWTPFSHPQITMRYTVPIFVARQEFKHIVGFARNEESRRYISSEPKFFTPSQFRKRPLSSIKQGSGDNMHPSGNKYWQRAFQAVHTVCMEAYTTAVEGGMCPEQARMILPQSM